jgi:NADH:ubiquinone oxidoreductase subunit B-like Fe-S oxidoreductase
MATPAEHHDHGLVDPELPFLTTKFEWLVQWARRSAIWPAQFGLPAAPSR